MKKIFAAVIALSLCGVMLTACGGNDTADETTASSDTTVSEETTTAAETEAETTEAATESETEAEADTPAADASGASFASIDELAAADLTALAGEKVDFDKSNSYVFASGLTDVNSLYMDIEDTKGEMKVAMGIEGSNIFMDMYEAESGTKMIIIIKDKVMYMLDPAQKSGVYYEADDEELGEYDVDALFDEMQIDEEALKNQAKVTTYAVEVDGKAYTLEVSGGTGMLFDAESKLRGLYNDEGEAFVVNDFTTVMPEGIFDVPEDYQLVDMAAMLSSAGGSETAAE